MAASFPEFSPDELNELLSAVMPEIPGYRVMRRIGRGGMSYVYLGVQESLDRQLAIKVIAPEALKDEVSRQRFEKEARTIAKLEHPCIVGIYEIGRTEQGLTYYVLPYLPKGHLRQRDLREDEDRILEVLRALLSALDYAHSRGIVHRDVKAENVMFDSMDRPVLTDFGIAVSKRDSVRMTGGGQAVGSGGYMAPEQARGERVDGRADLYSVGVLAFEMLTGRLPFQNPDTLGLALMHAQDPVPMLPAAKRHWQGYINKAMAKTPAQRYASAGEMLAALERVAVQRRIGEARRESRLRPMLSPARLPPAWRGPLLGSALTLAAVLLIGGIWSLWPRPSPGEVAAAALPVAVPEPAPEPAFVEPPPAAEAVHSEPVAEETAEPPPLSPGERELAAARQQIARGRLSLPPGDNALDSLRAAHAVRPGSRQLTLLGERWLGAAAPHPQAALNAGRDEQAKALLQRASGLAELLGLREGEAWAGLLSAIAVPLKARIESQHARADIGALRAAKAFASELGVPPALLEPSWSKPVVRARPGDLLSSGGSRLVLLRLPAEGRAGLAVLPTEVTREQYAAFARATARPEARCRVRTARVTLRKRSWSEPGFAQQGSHPVVCVSAADALAYADWLGQRDGVRYRLPDAAQWRQIAGAAAGDACVAGRIACGDEGTLAAAEGRADALGLRGLHGNVREWLADCEGAGCAQRRVALPGWRDAPVAAQAGGSESMEAAFGYDDVGFRLLREVAASEVELR
jgi:serine/threonine-protein kinase PpkA